MNRITRKLQALSARKEKALVCFLTAGFPTIDATLPLVAEIEKGGADIIELGMPFSDPLAEGPEIQNSSSIAIEQGVTLDTILSFVKTIRQSSEIPLVLMGYLNPIIAYSAEKFFRAAARAGVDGLILPELPFEESNRFKSFFENSDLANILLVTPTTPRRRIAMIDSASNGFLYCVSITGVTGSAELSTNTRYISKVKKFARKNPVLVGFGIKTPADAQRIAQYADGVIIGSALVQRISRKDSPQEIGKWVSQLKEALERKHDITFRNGE